MQILILSSNPDNLILWLLSVIKLEVPDLSICDKSKINLFVKRPTFNKNSSLIQLARKEYISIFERIDNLNLRFFNIVYSEQEADVVIKINKITEKIEGVIQSRVLVKWIATPTADKIWETGMEFILNRKIPLPPLSSIKNLGRVSSAYFGQDNRFGMILNVPGFLKECAFLLVFKSFLTK